MIIETIVATLIGVIVSRLYIERYYILLRNDGLKSVTVYNSGGELIRTIDRNNVAEYVRRKIE